MCKSLLLREGGESRGLCRETTMGMQVPAAVAAEDVSASAVWGQPSVVIVGPPNVGKHSILKRLVAKEELLKDDSSSDSTCHGWTIDTKYYTADVCIWTARLDALVSKDDVPPPLEHCEALLMVFDLSDVRAVYIITFVVFLMMFQG